MRGINRRRNKHSKSLNCLDCPVRCQAEWKVATDVEMGWVSDQKTTRKLRRGQLLYQQGQESSGVFCIQSGSLAVARNSPGGGPYLVRLAHAGRSLGYRNHLNQGVSTTSAKALESCTVCHIDTELLGELFASNRELEHGFQISLAEDLDNTETAMVELASLPVRSRVARLLLELALRETENGQDEEVRMRTTMTWRDMSELIFTRPETLTRTLQAMESDGVIFHKGHSIHIPRLEVLRAEGGLH